MKFVSSDVAKLSLLGLHLEIVYKTNNIRTDRQQLVKRVVLVNGNNTV